MVHGAVRGLLHFLEALALGLLLIAALLAWRFSQGPVILDRLTPYLEQALAAEDGSYSVMIDDTVLTWGGWRRALDLKAVGVHVLTAEEGVVASVPEVALALSGRALLDGEIAVSSLELVGPRIRVVRGVDGGLRWGLGGAPAEGPAAIALEEAFAALTAAGERQGRFAHLRRFEIVGGAVIIEDEALGAGWRLHDADIRLRRTADGLSAEIEVLVDLAGELTEVSGAALYDIGERRIQTALAFADMRPLAFAHFASDLAPLASLDLPLAGTMEATIHLDAGIEQASFTLSGGEGVLRLPAPVGVAYPVKAIRFEGAIQGLFSRIEIENGTIDLGGPVAELRGVAVREGSAFAVTAEAGVTNFPVDLLPGYWPPALAPKPRAWVVRNLSRGIAEDARMNVAGRLTPDGRFEIAELGGKILGKGVRVHYLGELPPVDNASGRCTFDRDGFHIKIDDGEAMGLRIAGGEIHLTGLSSDDERADIAVTITGPLGDALRLLDRRPLGFAARFGIRPEDVAGETTTALKIGFPLRGGLRLRDVAIEAHTELADVVLPAMLLDRDVRAARLRLDVGNDGMEVTGPITLEAIPLDLTWRENFAASAPFRSRYRLNGVLGDEERRRLGLDGPPFLPPHLTGLVAGEAVATFDRTSSGTVEASLDLSPAAMALPGLAWSKPAGEPARARARLRLEGGRPAAVESFAIEAADLAAGGGVEFSEGVLAGVRFDSLRFGRTDLRGRLVPRGEAGIGIVIDGGSFDLAPVLAADMEAGAAGATDTPITIQARLDRLWLSSQASLADIHAAFERQDGRWRSGSLRAAVEGGRELRLNLGQDERGRQFELISDDAGAVFRSLDVFDDIVGGRLRVTGRIDDRLPHSPMTGLIEVDGYHVVDAPVLARLLTVAALTGIVDVLRGDGIGFSRLEAAFGYADGLLEFTDARAYGAALGLTANGQVDLRQKRMALEGTIVPAYLLNSLIGNVPLLGRIFTGDKGSGIIAATYSMKGPLADPRVGVNPLASLAPGFLRNLFGALDGDGTKVRR